MVASPGDGGKRRAPTRFATWRLDPLERLAYEAAWSIAELLEDAGRVVENSRRGAFDATTLAALILVHERIASGFGVRRDRIVAQEAALAAASEPISIPHGHAASSTPLLLVRYSESFIARLPTLRALGSTPSMELSRLLESWSFPSLDLVSISPKERLESEAARRVKDRPLVRTIDDRDELILQALRDLNATQEGLRKSANEIGEKLGREFEATRASGSLKKRLSRLRDIGLLGFNGSTGKNSGYWLRDE